MRVALPLLALALLPGAAVFAQQPGVQVAEAAQAAPVYPTVEPRVNQLIIYGDDPCPQSTNDEIIVCARLPENDRYRIPPNVRADPDDPARQSWANRALELSYLGRTGTDSCSPTGPGGFTGCFNQIVSQARAERRGSDVNWNRMIEEAREERMRRIGEEEAQEAAEENSPD
jgi:hypothetical protein